MTMLLKPTVLILGATGQIGRFILGHLKQEPDAVHIRVAALASVMLRDKAGQSNSKSCLSRHDRESPHFEWFLERFHRIQAGFPAALQPKLKQILTDAIPFLTASSATTHILHAGFRHQTFLTVAP
jgi:nucleoside-diphosphate-sugar epimerase